MINTRRAGIVCYGDQLPQSAIHAFEQRAFHIASESNADPGSSGAIAAAVFIQSKVSLSAILRDIREHVPGLLDRDCRVFVRAISNQGLYLINQVLHELALPCTGLNVIASTSTNEAPPHPRVLVSDNNDPWHRTANVISEHPPGPIPNRELVIDYEDPMPPLDAREDCLVRRAFWDCAAVHLRSLTSGKSGVKVFLAYAELRGRLNGSLYPTPYFVKIGKRQSIVQEFIAYQEQVDPYIPFHLGPHLIQERCGLGSECGILVGDFVDESESLAECARAGRATPAIAALFGRTLNGWYRSAQSVDSSQPTTDDVVAKLNSKWQSKDPGLLDRLNFAKKLGASASLPSLLDLVTTLAPSEPLVGPIHGDLHADNVRVRGSDAVVIDFGAHTQGPLLFDAASLETSLLIDAFPATEPKLGRGKKPSIAETLRWMKTVESLYRAGPFACLREHPHPKNRSCWFHACVRHIRSHARHIQSSNVEYAVALGRALLFKVGKDLSSKGADAARRAAAYVFAERVLSHAANHTKKRTVS